MEKDTEVFTADNARNLMPERQVNSVLEILENDIREAAVKNWFGVKLRYSFKDNPQIDKWLSEAPRLGYKNGADRTSNPVMLALGILEKRGFSVDFYYDDGGQFADMGYRISWE